MTFIQQPPRDGKPRAPSKKRNRLPQGLRFDVFRRDNFTCIYCGGQSPQVTLECDHKTPASKGGTDTLDNLVTSCFDCNRGKGTKEVECDAPISTSGDPLRGRFGHSIVDGQIFWQFQVKGAVGDSYALQLYSWLDGCPTIIQMVKTTDLLGSGFRLYATERDWLRTAEDEMRRRRLEA